MVESERIQEKEEQRYEKGKHLKTLTALGRKLDLMVGRTPHSMYARAWNEIVSQ